MTITDHQEKDIIDHMVERCLKYDIPSPGLMSFDEAWRAVVGGNRPPHHIVSICIQAAGEKLRVTSEEKKKEREAAEADRAAEEAEKQGVFERERRGMLRGTLRYKKQPLWRRMRG